AGAVVATRDDRYLVYGRVVPTTADHILWVAREAYERCGPGPAYPTVVRGTLELVDLASAETRWSQAIRTNVFSDPAFSATGRWFRSEALAPAQCGGALTTWRSTAAPHLPPTFDDPLFYLERELADGRWIGWHDETFGVADPARQSSFVAMGAKVEDFAVGDGWVHAFDGYGDTTEVVRALAPDGARHDLTLSTDFAWRGRAARGRWVEVCHNTERPEIDRCTVFDVTGVSPSREVEVEPYSLVFLVGDVALFKGDDDGENVLVRLELLTGDRQIVARGPGKLHLLGNQEAALWQGTQVLLVEPTRTQIVFPGEVTQVVTLASAPKGADLDPGVGTSPRQRQLATLIDSPEPGRFRLHLFDLATRRVVTLSDHLHYAPVLAAPLAADTCGQPWTLRSAGNTADGYDQSARTFFFVEADAASPGYSLFVVPVDLTTPPRRLASVDPTGCHPPLESPDGSLIVLADDASNGTSTRLTMARPR
ncbi:MAG: hypothetical protein JNJ59_00385, partial [Deltaproteobacteria bacterium]|nr:hypothetical protein [Deltaproteobacteria bacterium]